jgi:hypothetical protein
MNIVPAPIFPDGQTNIKRVFLGNDIKKTSKIKMALNELPIIVQCENFYSHYFNERMSNTLNIEGPDTPDNLVFPLSTEVNIFLKLKDIREFGTKYNTRIFNTNSITSGFCDHIIPLNNGKKADIYLRVITTNEKMQPCGIDSKMNIPFYYDEYYIVYCILFHLPNVKLQVSGIGSREFIIQSFLSIEDENDMYCIFGNHQSEKKLISKSNKGEIILLKDLIMRIMTLFDVKFNTHCGKRTSYSIKIYEPYEDELVFIPNEPNGKPLVLPQKYKS